MNDQELGALTTLAHAVVYGMVAENNQRKQGGWAMAYGDADFWHTPEVEALRAELERRGILKNQKEEQDAEQTKVSVCS